MLQHHAALDGDIACRPPSGRERRPAGSVYLAPVSERASLYQPIPSLEEGDVSGPGPIPADAAIGLIAAATISLAIACPHQQSPSQQPEHGDHPDPPRPIPRPTHDPGSRRPLARRLVSGLPSTPHRRDLGLNANRGLIAHPPSVP